MTIKNIFPTKSLGILSFISLCALFIVYLSPSSNTDTVLSKQTDELQQASSEQAITPISNDQQTFSEEKSKILASEVTFETYTSAFGPLAKSLRGTRIPAAFKLDTEGHLIITSSIKSVIEYFLAANGEESIETIVGRIEEFFTQQLEEPARSEALDVLAQYIGYKESLIKLEEDLAENTKLSGKNSDYLTMFQYRREARMNNLSPEIYDAFFADEDKADSYTAGLLEIRKNKDLSIEEKAEQMLAIEQYLPPQEQAIKQAERTRKTLQENINTVRLSGANDEEVFQMRSEVYGYEAAERFALADKKKSDWNNRFKQYRDNRQAILINDGLSETDKATEIANLQTALFNPTEKLRLATLDKMADTKAQL